MITIEKILFPCDLTGTSSKLLPYVLSISEKYNAMVYLLHVVQDLHRWGKLYVPHTSMNKFQEEALEEAERLVDRFCKEDFQGCLNFQRRIVSGDPAAEILKIIVSEDIDIVVMGTHGRRGFERAVFGSVAGKVVKKSPVPVLTIDPNKLK